jgi:hypothetical protein
MRVKTKTVSLERVCFEWVVIEPKGVSSVHWGTLKATLNLRKISHDKLGDFCDEHVKMYYNSYWVRALCNKRGRYF